MLTSYQLRAARALIKKLTQEEVAEECGISKQALIAIEGETVQTPKSSTLQALQKYYEGLGIEFIEGGARFSNAEIKMYQGDRGFQNFFHDIYQTIKEGGDIAIQNGMPDYLIKHLGAEFYDMHAKRMARLNPDVRVLIKEGDTNLIGSSFARYKTVPAQHFNDQTVYIFGDKTGFITFGEQVRVLSWHNPDVARSQRTAFNAMWDNAKDVH